MRSVDYPKAIKAGRDWLIPRKWAEGFVKHKKSGGPGNRTPLTIFVTPGKRLTFAAGNVNHIADVDKMVLLSKRPEKHNKAMDSGPYCQR